MQENVNECSDKKLDRGGIAWPSVPLAAFNVP